ncbi:CotH kinase family protein [uncultured Cyclobacterium sp.]|uniref:CotH kinase family protein n=1 Tax=uncultured Cyclobacterium sp. TaxID=453820 RepID=UPI0030ED3EC0|tara:strand:- start:93097 stop:98427 length:5331 start_codon:yes stop_codon:yes gene_type:complete
MSKAIGVNFLLGLFLLVTSSSISMGQSIAINEIMASNSTIEDNDGDYSDWIELYNYGSEVIDLTGYGLSDNPSSPFKWAFPTTFILPNSYLLVWASSKDRKIDGEPLHTSYGISAGGEDVVLTDPEGQQIDIIPGIPIPTNFSYGRQPDGIGTLQFFDTPTPNGQNLESGVGTLLSPPVSSHPSGYYNEPFLLSLTSETPGATIIYTVDGSEPDIENLSGTSYQYVNQYPQHPGQTLGPLLDQSFVSHSFSSPIEVNDRSGEPNKLSAISTTYNHSTWYLPTALNKKAMVVRAKAYKDDLSSQTNTFTYFVSGASGFDHSLPVVSLNLSEDGLFDFYKGIMVAGEDFVNWREQNPDLIAHGGRPANYGRSGNETEQPASFHLFVDKELVLDQNIGLRLHGGFSRELANKTFRLYARSDYDEQNTFDYPIFDNYEFDSFKRLLLRNSGNDRNLTFFRDAFMQESISHLTFETQKYQPAVVYLNGEYWGMANFRERYDRHFLERKYGIGEFDLDLLENDAAVEEGENDHYLSMRNFIATSDLSIEENFDYVNTLMDVDNFLDYQVAEIYFNNDDWPQNNVRYFRKRIPEYNPEAPLGQDGRWRWMMFDTDVGFGLNGSFTSNTLAHATNPTGSKTWSTLILRRLLMNEGFKNEFINRFADLINTAMLPERLHAVIDEMSSKIASEIPAHRQRWTSLSNWESNINVVKEFAVNRPEHQMSHLMDYFGIDGTHAVGLNVSDVEQGYIKINSTPINSETPGVSNAPYPWSGKYFDGIPVSLVAIPQPGFQFSHWSGDVESSEPTISITPTSDLNIIANFSPEEIPENQSEILYFWLFDTNIANDTPLENLQSTYSISEVPGEIQYASALVGYPFTEDHPNWGKSSMERRNSPTPLNYQADANEGLDYGAIKMRGIQIKQAFKTENSENIININVSTLGYRSIKVSFAAIDEGAAERVILEYLDTLSGNYSAAGMAEVDKDLFEEYKVFEFNLSEVPLAVDNPDLKLRIRFEGANMFVDEGDRVTLNNIMVTGVSTSSTCLTPPPSSEAIFYCEGALLEDLSDGSASLNWYLDPTDSEKLDLSTPVESGIYFLSQSIDGCESSKVQIVIMPDEMGPTLVTQDIEVYLNQDGIATILPEDIDRASTDICGILEMNISKSEFSFEDLGENLITFNAVDNNGNESSKEVKVTVLAEEGLFVNLGSSSIAVSSGIPYLPLSETNVIPSAASTSQLPGAGAGELFNTVVFGAQVTFQIPVPNGQYVVSTMHKETYYGVNGPGESGRRVFSISLQGVEVKRNLDLFNTFGNNEGVLQFDKIIVDNGLLTLSLDASINNALISGFSVVKSDWEAAPPAQPSMFVNTGSSDAVSLEGETFQSDFATNYFANGSNTSQYSVASESALFQSHRYGQSVVYRIPVINGSYTVATYHNETYFGKISGSERAGQRVFSIALQGNTVKENLDLFSEYDNKEATLIFENVQVVNGEIELILTATSNNATISGFAILPQGADVPILDPEDPQIEFSYFVNTGGPQLLYEEQSFDSDLKNSYYTSSNSSRFDDLSAHELFKTHRFGPQFSYQIPVPNGLYTVFTFHNELYFGKKISTTGIGRRVFNISLEGNVVKNQLDLFNESNNGALVLEFEDIQVEDGILDIDLLASINSATISGIGLVAQNNTTVLETANLRTLNDLSEGYTKEVLMDYVNLPSSLNPNPADQEATITIYKNQGEFSIQIFSSNGNLIEALTTNTDFSGPGEYTIQTDKLAGGFYLVVILFENGAIERHKLMIAH